MDNKTVFMNQQEELNKLSLIADGFDIEYQTFKPNIDITHVFDNDCLLDKFTSRIRSEWLQKNMQLAAGYDKSPWRGESITDSWGNEYHYTYETLL